MLIDSTGHLKLTDFGLSQSGYKVAVLAWVKDFYFKAPTKRLSQTEKNSGDISTRGRRNSNKKRGILGTPNYLAPEVIEGKPHDGAVDWWAVGIIAFEMLTGSLPYAGNSPEEIFEHILADKKDCVPSVGEEEDDVSRETWSLIEGLLQHDPEKRLGNKGAGELKSHGFFAGLDWNTLREQEPPFKPAVAGMHDTSYASKKWRGQTEDDFMKELSTPKHSHTLNVLVFKPSCSYQQK